MKKPILLLGSTILTVALAQTQQATLGQMYTLCKGTSDAVSYQINKLEYSIGNYIYDGGDTSNVLPDDRKGLLIYLTVQNPQAKAFTINADSIRITGLDSKSEDLETDGYWYEQSSLVAVDTEFKAGQKMNVVTRVEMDADTSLQKLMVEDCQNSSWTYDTRGKVQGLPAPFKDPRVADGSSALRIFPAQLAVVYPGLSNFKVDKFEFSSAKFDGVAPTDGGRWLVVYFTVNNPAKQAISLYSGLAKVSYTDQTGKQSAESEGLFMANQNTAFDSAELGGKQTLAFKAIIEVPKNVQAKKLQFKWHGSRTAEFDISNLK